MAEVHFDDVVKAGGRGGGVEVLPEDRVFGQGDEREVGRMGMEGDWEATTRASLTSDQ